MRLIANFWFCLVFLAAACSSHDMSYHGPVRYLIMVVCEGEDERIVFNREMYPDRLEILWSAVECKKGPTTLKYQARPNWKECHPGAGTEVINPLSPEFDILLMCDPP